MRYPLSKSKYCMGVNCPKALWLDRNRKEAFDRSVMNESVLENGSAVGDYAMQLFGEFTEVPFSNDLSQMIKKTDELLEKGTAVICEASFSYDSCFCSVDILRNFGDGVVELYEVKSSTGGDEKSDKEKTETYKNDVAFQTYVLTKLGFTVRSSNLVLLNRNYVRHGAVDITELFHVLDLTPVVQPMLADVELAIASLRSVLSKADEPACPLGAYCHSPYECGFFKYCTRNLPSPNVFDVGFSLSFSTKLKLFEKDVISYEDMVQYAGDASQKPKINGKQLRQVSSWLNGAEDYVDAAAVSGFLEKLTYPLYFLDFEGVQFAIPEYDDSRPYQQVCFQYSLHYIEEEGGPLKHTEFLAYPGKDPRRELCEHLCADIPADGCVLVYSALYEGPRIKEMAALFPDLAPHLISIADHIVDLADPFKAQHYYSWRFGGSYSIKAVLPGLFPGDPELDYHSLDGVHNGQEATQAFIDMHHMTADELKEKRAQLLKYCGLDTFAMVKLWEKLKAVCGGIS